LYSIHLTVFFSTNLILGFNQLCLFYSIYLMIIHCSDSCHTIQIPQSVIFRSLNRDLQFLKCQCFSSMFLLYQQLRSHVIDPVSIQNCFTSGSFSVLIGRWSLYFYLVFSVYTCFFKSLPLL
jgi:hypothetical protein